MLTLKNDKTFVEELTCRFKIDIRRSQELENLKNLVFKGLFSTKYIMLELKKYRGVMLMALKIDAKFDSLVLSKMT